jgi:hypothetical protein
MNYKKIISFFLCFLLLLIIFFSIRIFKKVSPILSDLAGFDHQKTYFVLLQNNFELRPSGGFMGSYAKIKFKNGGLENVLIQDIYVPDGKLENHVDPPWPIQTAFQQGWWKLRDSNWEPDFPLASEQIQWFFKKGGEEKIDGLIAVNFLVVKDLIKIFEPIDLADYNLQITSENFYQITQQQAEKDFFPGSTQKKDFLSALSKQLILRLKSMNHHQSLQLIKVLKKSLNEKQILISLNNPDANKLLKQLNWDGTIKRNYQDGENLIADYIYIVDTNLGANKANLYVEKRVEQKIDINKNLVKEKLKINYVNNSPEERPNYEDFWGGLYENFLRILLPIEAENIRVNVNDQSLEDKIEIKEYKDKKIKSIGFFVEVPPLSETNVEISYEKKFTAKKDPVLQLRPTPGVKYILEIQKQPGIESYPHIIKTKKWQIEKNIRSDEVIKKANLQ